MAKGILCSEEETTSWKELLKPTMDMTVCNMHFFPVVKMVTFSLFVYVIQVKVSLSWEKVSAINVYAYRLMHLDNNFNITLRGRTVLQQLVADTYCKIESECLLFIRAEQKKLRADSYSPIQDSLAIGPLSWPLACLEHHHLATGSAGLEQIN